MYFVLSCRTTKLYNSLRYQGAGPPLGCCGERQADDFDLIDQIGLGYLTDTSHGFVRS